MSSDSESVLESDSVDKGSRMKTSKAKQQVLRLMSQRMEEVNEEAKYVISISLHIRPRRNECNRFFAEC